MSNHDLRITNAAKGGTASLSLFADLIDDRDAARVIYAELKRIAKKLEDKHNFGKKKHER